VADPVSPGSPSTHLAYPDRELHLEEAYFFQFDERGVITRVEIFWQSPQVSFD
jgi:hypothetical protein